MLEVQYLHDPWKMLVSCILLNRTTRLQVDRMIDELFNRWPTPHHMAKADRRCLARILKPLGLYNRRAIILKRFSRHYLQLDHDWITLEDVYSLPGIGDYALDAWDIFMCNNIRCRPDDKQLKRYLRWKRSIR